MLLYAKEDDWTKYSEAEMAAVMRDHRQVVEGLRKSGKKWTCDALEPTRAATTGCVM